MDPMNNRSREKDNIYGRKFPQFCRIVNVIVSLWRVQIHSIRYYENNETRVLFALPHPDPVLIFNSIT